MNLLNQVAGHGYKDAKEISGGRVAALQPMIFTHAILVFSDQSILYGYEDRWCYQDYKHAKAALAAWNGEGEPKGWHWHPSSGRRRDEQGKDYVNP